jgi:fibroblast growth factor receptor substrate 2
LPRLSIHNGPSRLSSVGSSNGCTSPSSPLGNINYVNEEIFRPEEKFRQSIVVPEEPPPIEHKVQSQSTPLSPALSGESPLQDDSLFPVYMNVMPGTELPSNNNDIEEDRHCYANLIPGDFEVFPKLTGKHPLISQHSTVSCVAEIPPSIPRHVNYIVLDLDKKNTVPPSSVTAPESPHKVSEGYVTIDFDRTVALSHSINPSIENDSECLRKTRHDSTFNDLVTPTSSRQCTSLSD